MVRKLSLGSWRRSSKASRDGSLRENMARADKRASPRGMSGWPERVSGMRRKRSRSSRKRESADRALRAFLAERTMVGNSFCPKVKIGKPGKYSVRWDYERKGQNQSAVIEKTTGRELLSMQEPPMGLL